MSASKSVVAIPLYEKMNVQEFISTIDNNSPIMFTSILEYDSLKINTLRMFKNYFTETDASCDFTWMGIVSKHPYISYVSIVVSWMILYVILTFSFTKQPDKKKQEIIKKTQELEEEEEEEEYSVNNDVDNNNN